MPDFNAALAAAVQLARSRRNVTVAVLAQTSGVSRAMIGKIERGEAQPTAALLAKLSVALGVTLSELIAHAENRGIRLRRHEEQSTWRDPSTGFERRALSPSTETALELIEATLPAGAEVSYPADIFRLAEQQIWVLEGHLTFCEGSHVHELSAGDCLHLGPPQDCTFRNIHDSACRYLVALNKRGPQST